MLAHVDLPLVLATALAVVASPGPSTLAIAGTAMERGRRHGLVLASGISMGSLTWSVAAALGLGAVMTANAWVFEILRWTGCLYLGYLALRSARSAFSPNGAPPRALGSRELRRTFLAGYALHITNPKAILFFGALYVLGVPADASGGELATVMVAVWLQSVVVFHGYALLFSHRWANRAFLRFRRRLDALFAIGFGAASVKLMTTNLR